MKPFIRSSCFEFSINILLINIILIHKALSLSYTNINGLRYNILHNSPSARADTTLLRNQDTIITSISFASFSLDWTILRSNIYHSKSDSRNTSELANNPPRETQLFVCGFPTPWGGPGRTRRGMPGHTKAKVTVLAPQWRTLAFPRRYTFQAMPWPVLGFVKFSKRIGNLLPKSFIDYIYKDANLCIP